MAYLIQRGEIFYAAWYRPGARVPIKRSTKSSNRKEAQKIADMLHAADAKEITAARLYQLADEIRGGGKITIREHCQDWQKASAGNWKPATRLFYESVVVSFLSHLGAAADKSISKLTRDQILEWRDAQADRVSRKTANNRLKGIRSALKAAVQAGHLDTNPADQVSTLKIMSRSERGAFTSDQVKILLEAAEGEWKGLILLAVYTGQRLGDIAALTWRQVDLAAGVIRLTTGKTGARLAIPIPAPLKAHLLAMPEKEGPMHPNAARIVARGKGVGQLSNDFADLLLQCGLRKAAASKGQGRGGLRTAHALSFHSLRHTAVTMLKEAGVPHAVVQALIGHESDAISQHYTHVGDDALREAASKMPDVTA
jgi:integrase